MVEFFTRLGDVFNLIWTYLSGWTWSAIDSLEAFFLGGQQLFQQITGSFSSMVGTPLGILSIVAFVGVGYIVVRILIHLL